MIPIKSGRPLKMKKRYLYCISFKCCRDDKIRTCDPTPPRRVRYRAALHPEFFEGLQM